jgi:hypothetical protein
MSVLDPAPGAGYPWTTLLVTLSVPLLMALVMVVNLRRREEVRWRAWVVATFLAGVGNLGFGSVIVGLLYYTVE